MGDVDDARQVRAVLDVAGVVPPEEALPEPADDGRHDVDPVRQPETLEASRKRGLDVREDVPDDDVLEQDDQQNQDDRRNVDAAQIRHDRADRPQHRLGDLPEEIAHHMDELVPRVDHVEGDQPRQDRGGDQEPDVKVEDDQDDGEDGAHGI